jgi:hypothetical protein
MNVWLTARGAGLSALVLLTVATSLGAVVTSHGSARTRVVLQHVHRVASSLGIGVLVVHIATVIADSYAHVGVTGAIVPFTAGYRATWVGLGTIATYLMLLAAVLGFTRGRLATSPRAVSLWRKLHALGYAGWAIAMVHGFASGTDSAVTWVRLLYVACAVAVATSVVARLTGRRSPRSIPARSHAVPRILEGAAR